MCIRDRFENVSFSLPPGGIVGVIGPNGAGKTTLFRMIVGQQKPDAGSLAVGPTVKLAYVDQSREVIDPDKSVWQQVSLRRPISSVPRTTPTQAAGSVRRR